MICGLRRVALPDHQDWKRPDMDVYRAKLAALAAREGVPLGRRVDRVRSSC